MGGITEHEDKLLKINSIKSAKVPMLKPRPCLFGYWR